MPASTRSASKQTKLEDVAAGNNDAKSTKSAAKTPTAGKKRKADDAPKAPNKKVAKSAKKSPENEGSNDDGDAVVINRAPVLELWAGCVTQAIYGTVAWETCLSVGSAISTITAISKGRSIGKIDKPDAGEAQAKRDKRKEQAEKEELDEVEVMSFNLRLKDGLAMVGDKPKKPNEEALRKKYGGAEQYDKVKKAFEEALKTWRGKEDELDQRAFHMYEDFRPSVKPGQAGWGRKGQLSINTIRNVVTT